MRRRAPDADSERHGAKTCTQPAAPIAPFCGFLTYAGSAPVTVTGNSFSPAIPNALYNDGSAVDASNNWWGCNGGANSSGCATRTGPAATTVEPHLVLRAAVADNPVHAGDTTTVTGAVDRNSAGDPVTTSFPGATVTFATSVGALDRASAPLTGGSAVAQLTAPGAAGTADVSVALDNAVQQLTLTLDVSEAAPTAPTITVDGGVTAARSATSLAVSGVGDPGASVQVTVNGVNAGLPVTVTGGGTWSTSVTLVDGDNALAVVQDLLVADGPTVVGVYAPVISSPAVGDEVPPLATVAGTGIDGATVAVADENAAALGGGSVDSDGEFGVALAALAPGAHTLSVTQTTGGVTSVASTVAVTVPDDPDPPTETTPTETTTPTQTTPPTETTPAKTTRVEDPPADTIAAAPPAPAVDTVKPALSKVGLTAKQVRRGRAASLRFTLSEPAAVRVTVERKLSGRTRGKRCVTGAKAPARGARCTVWKTVRTATVSGRQGANTVTLLSRTQSRRLGAGAHRVALTATDRAGNRSPVALSGFTASTR